MKRTINFSFLLVFFSLFIFLSCEKNSQFQEASFFDFGEKGMVPNFQYVFYPFKALSDSSGNDCFSITLAVRYTSEYKYKNLPLKVEYLSSEPDTIIERILSVPLFDDKDGFTGKGNLGIYEAKVPLIEITGFGEDFFISIETPENNTNGILSLGVICKNYINETYSR